MYSDRVTRRLQDIVDDAATLERLLTGIDADAFVGDDRTVLAVERLLQRITEAVIPIGADDMARIAPAISARQVRDFGNLLRHQYADVDSRVVYTVARENVPMLAAAAIRALGD